MDMISHLKKVGVITTFLFVGGLAGHLANLKTPLLNPPVGPLDDYWLPLALVLGLGITLFLPLVFRGRRGRTQIVVSCLLAVLILCAYGWSLLHYGRVIDVPARDIYDFVVVGKERTAFANEFFQGIDDVGMMLQRGWSESDLTLYWSKNSLEHARITVLAAYVMTLSSLNLIVSTVAAQSKTATSRRRAKKKKSGTVDEDE